MEVLRQEIGPGQPWYTQGGRFLKLIETTGPVDIKFNRRTTPLDAKQVEAGYKLKPLPPGEDFHSAVITSATVQTVGMFIGQTEADYDRVLGIVEISGPVDINGEITVVGDTADGCLPVCNSLDADDLPEPLVVEQQGVVEVRAASGLNATDTVGLPIKNTEGGTGQPLPLEVSGTVNVLNSAQSLTLNESAIFNRVGVTNTTHSSPTNTRERWLYVISGTVFMQELSGAPAGGGMPFTAGERFFMEGRFSFRLRTEADASYQIFEVR